MSISCIFQFLRMRWQSWVLPRSKLTWHMSTVVRLKMPTQPRKFNGSLMVLWRQLESALKHIPLLHDLQDLYLMTIPQVRAKNQYILIQYPLKHSVFCLKILKVRKYQKEIQCSIWKIIQIFLIVLVKVSESHIKKICLLLIFSKNVYPVDSCPKNSTTEVTLINQFPLKYFFLHLLQGGESLQILAWVLWKRTLPLPLLATQ